MIGIQIYNSALCIVQLVTGKFLMPKSSRDLGSATACPTNCDPRGIVFIGPYTPRLLWNSNAVQGRSVRRLVSGKRGEIAVGDEGTRSQSKHTPVYSPSEHVTFAFPVVLNIRGTNLPDNETKPWKNMAEKIRLHTNDSWTLAIRNILIFET